MQSSSSSPAHHTLKFTRSADHPERTVREEEEEEEEEEDADRW